jgi:PAS domain S-box-containing protein/putative nucleotidyltransferase with HDIG domain
MAAFALGLGLASSTTGIFLGVLVRRHRRLRDEFARYHVASHDLLASIDRSGRLTSVNVAWVRALGHTAGSVVARDLLEFVHCDERTRVRAQLERAADRGAEGVESCNRFRTADGKYRWLEWQAATWYADGVVHVIARDVTEQRTAQQQLANSARSLEAKIAERTQELDEARAETLQLLAGVVEYRDDQTFQHTERVGVLAAEIATRLGLRVEQIARLREAAALHDIGKIAIPDRVLLKPGRLDSRQKMVMETHAALGARLLSRSSSPVLQMAAVLAATHHEWWNGTGYPSALEGERIPLVGRIVAVADVFDALTHERPYMPAWPVNQAIARVTRASGSQFDPRVVDAFLAVHEDAQLTIVSIGDRNGSDGGRRGGERASEDQRSRKALSTGV